MSWLPVRKLLVITRGYHQITIYSGIHPMKNHQFQYSQGLVFLCIPILFGDYTMKYHYYTNFPIEIPFQLDEISLVYGRYIHIYWLMGATSIEKPTMGAIVFMGFILPYAPWCWNIYQHVPLSKITQLRRILYSSTMLRRCFFY